MRNDRRTMKPLAFLTMDSLDDFVSYDALVADCLKARGVKVDNVSWRSRTVKWDDYEMVIIRSPWDYQQAADEFMTVLGAIDASTAVLLNPIDVVRWNVRKTYLQELHDRGITIVPHDLQMRFSDSEHERPDVDCIRRHSLSQSALW